MGNGHKDDPKTVREHQMLQQLQAIINALPGLVSVVDPDFKVLYANDAVIEKFGQSDLSQVIGKPCYEVRKGRQTICEPCGLKKALEIKETVTRVSTPEEEALMGIATKAYAVPLLDETGEVWGGVEVITDVTDLRQQERALVETEARLQQILGAAPDGIMVGRLRDYRLLFANSAAGRMFGYSAKALTAMTVRDIHPKAHVDDVIRSFELQARGERLTVFDIPCLRKDGTVFFADVSSKPMTYDGEACMLGFFSDATERRLLQEERRQFEQQVQRTQKLEALGVLAGGIAHDFNNLLGGIFGYMELAKSEAPPSRVIDYIDKSLATIDRARGLTRQLLTFAKGGAPVKRVRPLSPLVEETVEFALSGTNITCQFDIADNLYNCEFDKQQLSQVIDNIVINATQAMPMGGEITVTAKNTSRTEQESDLAAGDYVVLSFRDTGVGMPEEMLARIFDPFFTTKQVGSGLGLATSYSIIKRHKGTIEVASTPGEGATFSVFLPAVPGPFTQTVIPPEPHRLRGGRLLIMDDEPVIRETVSALCASLGYEVTCETNGRDAVARVEKARASGKPFDALILDLTIPGGMGGREAIEVIRKIDHDVVAFVSSGYADDPVMADPNAHGFTDSIRKPFRRAELAELLDGHLTR